VRGRESLVQGRCTDQDERQAPDGKAPGEDREPYFEPAFGNRHGTDGPARTISVKGQGKHEQERQSGQGEQSEAAPDPPPLELRQTDECDSDRQCSHRWKKTIEKSNSEGRCEKRSQLPPRIPARERRVGNVAERMGKGHGKPCDEFSRLSYAPRLQWK
jgi:hypothetical protein